jgi:hypothetical protein
MYTSHSGRNNQILSKNYVAFLSSKRLIYDLINIWRSSWSYNWPFFIIFWWNQIIFYGFIWQKGPHNIWTIVCKNDHCAAKAVALLYSWPCWRARSPCGAPWSRSAWCVCCVCSMLSADILALTKYELKFIFFEKATKFCQIFTSLLTTVHTVKSKEKISQNFVTFSEYMNFMSKQT